MAMGARPPQTVPESDMVEFGEIWPHAVSKGPALWVYNDAEFPADDFDRICTFAGCFSKRIHCANGHNVKEGGLMLILMLTAVMSQLGLAMRGAKTY